MVMRPAKISQVMLPERGLARRPCLSLP